MTADELLAELGMTLGGRWSMEEVLSGAMLRPPAEGAVALARSALAAAGAFLGLTWSQAINVEQCFAWRDCAIAWLRAHQRWAA
jgi:hypothetical protein